MVLENIANVIYRVIRRSFGGREQVESGPNGPVVRNPRHLHSCTCTRPGEPRQDQQQQHLDWYAENLSN